MLKGYRTLIINVLSFLAFALGWEPLQEFVNPQIVVLAVTVVNALLRLITTTPVGKKS